MAAAAGVWPVKKREIFNRFFDSRVWNDFVFRDDDIIIGTYAKSGTTWVQQIVGQLLFNGAENIPVAEMSPWLDLTLGGPADKARQIAAQTHRRFIKTHLPADALVISPRVKYIYVARDGRDVAWSMYNHQKNFTSDAIAAFNNNPFAGPGPAMEPQQGDAYALYRRWIDEDGAPWWPFWENIRTWWAIRDLPNVLLVHFAALKRDMPGEIRRLAAFLEIPIDEARWPAIVEHSSFDYMKAHAELAAPLGGALWEGGGSTFVYKGTNGRWRDALSAEECRDYEARAERELGKECAHWLATGERLA